MAKKSSDAKHTCARPEQRNRMTAQERSVADTSVIPSKQAWDTNDASPGFGPRSFDPDRRTEHLGYRDPEEPSQGPLRLDETNYSVERLTLPEGGYNEYADEVGPSDEEDAQHSDQAQRLQYRDTQDELLSDLPPGDVNPAYEPDDPDLGFRLTTEHLETAPEGYVDRDAEKVTHYAERAARRGNRTDELIREDVYEALDNRADIDAPDISLHVRDGTVIIEGEVSDAMVRHRVEQCVDSVDGVKDINNRLHLAAPQPRRPWSDE
ncbi:BON domain-containing protein [Dyella sp.]|uniref:BON domain-containing protein n=1 Tax=Dyella sp. TaxID=1869338 RepID=UPI002B493E4B|nr:BON domain-containing protein [Dyella sp.]HKT28029.1 BON domain-containing protein [Dyella sp.]